jgi:glycosyltransferase involved in cell wall biosynthesis
MADSSTEKPGERFSAKGDCRLSAPIKDETNAGNVANNAGRLRRLLIVSDVVHYRHANQWFAFGAYAREIEIWADLFPQVIIAAPVRNGLPEGHCLPLMRSNIALVPMLKTNGKNKRQKAVQLFWVAPRLVWRLARAMRLADAIQVRCPAHIGLVAVVLAPLFSRYLIARYTADWRGYSGEPWIWRLQRALLRSAWWKGLLLVYGDGPNQPSNVVPVFNSVLTAEEIERARVAARKKNPTVPLTVLYVGRLSAWKNVDVLVSAVACLVGEGVRLQCYVVGDGPERAALEEQARQLDLRSCIEFVGGVPLERVLDFYERSDVLVLASESEGWPKAIVEGMAFGLICIGSNRGLVSMILGEGRGLVVPPRDTAALTSALRQITNSPESYRSMRERSASWAQQYSRDGVREAFRTLLNTHWRTSIGSFPDRADTARNTSGV